MPTSLPVRPTDATLSVTKAARLLGVHPNTIRAWSDAGRLRYYRINPRGDRRYRLGDLQRFLAAAETGLAEGATPIASRPWGGRRSVDPAAAARFGSTARQIAEQPVADPLDAERHRLDLGVASSLTRLVNVYEDADEGLSAAVQALRDAYGHHLVVVWEARGERLAPRAVAGAQAGGPPAWSTSPVGTGSSARRSNWPPAGTGPPAARCPGSCSMAGRTIRWRSSPTTGPNSPWRSPARVNRGASSMSSARPRAHSVRATSTSPGSRPTPSGRWSAAPSAPMRSPTCSIGPRPFGAWRPISAAGSTSIGSCPAWSTTRWSCSKATGPRVFLQHPDGHVTAEVTRNLSAAYVASVRDFPERSLPAAAVAALQPLYAVDYRNDPRGEGVRAAVVQEGFDTLCTAPLMDGTHLLGLLNVYHDRPHHWTPDELDTIGALATQASVAIQAAQDFERMATWAAQLQSIQQLGTRLSRLSSVAEHRPVDRDRAAPAHRLPQRPRLPAGRQRPHPGRDAGPGRGIRRRDAGPVARRGRRGHHRLGRGTPGRPEPRRRRCRSARGHDPRDRGRPR